ncbi:hypothetical protein B0J11DRAFT_611297 [Dendryphion nanum]|uniref:Uncharacterized protein n=1 Tax=Dendryphion nanum TaxID=256645 RepID=A0A9P9EDY5_9PLEO|nr:hypothetical protein B0J11DRAFT_611297 [Dendryphion nanum]
MNTRRQGRGLLNDPDDRDNSDDGSREKIWLDNTVTDDGNLATDNISVRVKRVKVTRAALRTELHIRQIESRINIRRRLRKWMELKELAYMDYLATLQSAGQGPNNPTAAEIAAAKKRRTISEAKVTRYMIRNKDIGVGARSDAHRSRRYATCRYEDFEHFQNPVHRWNKGEDLTGVTREIDLQRRQDGARLFKNGGVDQAHQSWVHDLIQAFDEKETGLVGLDHILEPDELKWITPPWRYRPMGLGRPHERNHQEANYGRQHNDAGVETERQRIEDTRGRVEASQAGSGDGWKNHTQRRRAEEAMANRADAAPELKHRKRTGTSGLHIAAHERSNDWPTSYDCTGIIKPGLLSTETWRSAASRAPESSDNTENRRRRPGTTWTEEAYGRREYHVHNLYRPVSPVNSPPHSPVLRPNVGTSIPSDMPPAEPRIAEYRQKFTDHYGIEDARWPKRPIRVSYSPRDEATEPSPRVPRIADTLDNAGRLALPAEDGFSMAMYRQIAAEARAVFSGYQRALQADNEETHNGGNGDSPDGEIRDDLESDEEGDLFHTTYQG